MHHYLDLVQPYLDRYGYIAIFVGVGMEGFGVPAPGETLIIAGAVLASQGQMNVALVLLVSWSAAVIGDNIGYAIGHFGGRPLVLRFGRLIGLRSEHMDRVERFFHRYGGGIVALARFFDVLRQLNGVVAGTSGMSWWRFFAYNALGATLWVGLWGAGVYFLGRHVELDAVLDVLHRARPYVIGVAAALFIALVIYVVQRHRDTGS